MKMFTKSVTKTITSVTYSFNQKCHNSLKYFLVKKLSFTFQLQTIKRKFFVILLGVGVIKKLYGAAIRGRHDQMTLSILNIIVVPSLIDLIAECRIFIVILGVILECS
jgi:hypothetical protein